MILRTPCGGSFAKFALTADMMAVPNQQNYGEQIYLTDCGETGCELISTDCGDVPHNMLLVIKGCISPDVMAVSKSANLWGTTLSNKLWVNCGFELISTVSTVNHVNTVGTPLSLLANAFTC